MDDIKKTKKQLLEEIKELRQCVAELKGFEEEIRQTRVDHEKFTKAFLQNSIPAGITTLKEGRFVDVSDAFLRLMGRKRDEVIGHTSIEIGFITEEQRAMFFNELNTKGRIENFEMKVKTKGGALRYGLFNAVMMSLKDEKYLLTVMTDISELKRNEQALRESEAKIRNAFYISPDSIIVSRLRDGAFVTVNKAFTEVLGYTEEDTAGKTTLEINLWADLADRNKLIEMLRATGRVESFEAKFRAKNGELRHGLVSATLFEFNGERHVLTITRDITERKQVEAEKEKLEAQNRQLQKAESLGRMGQAIAHTFNNQLSVVIGNLELALMDLPQDAAPVHNLTAAMQAANKAAAVSGQMLTYLGQSFDKREPLDLAKVCLRNLPILEASLPGKVVLESCFPSPGPAVMANENRVQQILTNLITNAWEAIGEDRGIIYLSIKTVSPADITAAHRFPLDWQPQDNDYACLKVTDTGCGIADQDIENLFDPFFSSKFMGRGLGLPVILGIAKAHGGAVKVESKPGLGSTFRVFFPVSHEDKLGTS